jgi:hypothetical protein
LQNLIELKLSNNNIKSISSLKSLPSIKEIDISYNQIKSIDGIQNLLTLETLNCNHNLIYEINFHQIYDKINKKQSSTTTTTTTTTSSVSTSNTTKNSSATNKNSIAITTSSTNSIITKNNNNYNNTSMKNMELPSLGICLNEIYVANNRIRSIEGLVHLKGCIDTIDISSNNFLVDTGNYKNNDDYDDNMT